MILVTGAGGKTGRAVIRALRARGAEVRALVHHHEQSAALTALGARETMAADMRLMLALRRAVENVRAVYHICPNVHPDEVAIGRSLVAAAKAAGVEHFVYHSVLHPQTEKMPHHWNKLRVEELLFESGLPVTVLQPTAYMQNLLAGWKSIVEEGVLRVPYSVEARVSLVDLENVAEAAARVLTEPGHSGATYELVGAPALAQTEAAEALSRALGRAVRAEAESLEAWERRSRAAGLSEYAIETLIKMYRYYERWGLAGNPNVLGWLLQRTPTTLTAFVERTVRERER
jgi:uncharacterized protein YbjT (DUF2867 family)